MKPEELSKYAQMLVRLGVNVQPGQTLVLRSPTEAAPLARKVVELAYQAGAAHVIVDWSDDEIDRIRLQMAPQESLSLVLEGKANDLTQALENGAATLRLHAPKPQYLRDVPADRIGEVMKSGNAVMRRFNELAHTGKVSWSIGMLPTTDWATLVFPDLPEEEAMEKLWEYMKVAIRLDQEDPVEVWSEHVRNLEARTAWLNERQFVKLIYQSPGTDLVVELPENHIWIGGGLKNAEGTFFLPNMPTEEVFTSPAKKGVNGTVRNTLPLSYNGQFIDGFSLRIEQGQVVEVRAEQGEDLLKSLINIDAGASYLGEVALVPQSSPIAKIGVVFQNSLFDENASCHFALGSAYPLCIEGGTKMTAEEREAYGINTSLLHLDFMMGSEELSVDGITQDGKVVPLMRGGNFVF